MECPISGVDEKQDIENSTSERIVSHSHLPVQHLLKQVELFKSRRESRSLRPEWLNGFIERVAELFEPLADDGRVGFDCQMLEDRWIFGLYLGATEIVGGPEDGQLRYTNFQFDVHGLIDRFCQIERLTWNAFPEVIEGASSEPRSSITVDGLVETNALRLQVYSIPPDDAGPGFRKQLDGEREPS